MTKLQCKKCNYAFDKDEIPKRCPYCSAKGSIIPYKTAQDWLNDSEA